MTPNKVPDRKDIVVRLISSRQKDNYSVASLCVTILNLCAPPLSQCHVNVMPIMAAVFYVSYLPVICYYFL